MFIGIKPGHHYPQRKLTINSSYILAVQEIKDSEDSDQILILIKGYSDEIHSNEIYSIESYESFIQRLHEIK